MVRIVVFAGGGVLAVVGGALVWFGLNVTTCTMCDTDSLVTGVVLSTPVYVLAIILLLYGQPSITSSVLAFALVPLLGNQIYYAIKITYVVLFLGGCACAAYQPYPIDSYSEPGMFVLVSGPLLLVTASAILSIFGYRILTMERFK